VNDKRIVRTAGIHTNTRWRNVGTPTKTPSVTRSPREKARRRRDPGGLVAGELMIRSTAVA